MADVAVELPPQAPHKKNFASIVPISDIDVNGNDSVDEYSMYKQLQRELEYIQLQEEYIKDEQRLVYMRNKGKSAGAWSNLSIGA